jgi:hypothetical protein
MYRWSTKSDFPIWYVELLQSLPGARFVAFTPALNFFPADVGQELLHPRLRCPLCATSFRCALNSKDKFPCMHIRPIIQQRRPSRQSRAILETAVRNLLHSPNPHAPRSPRSHPPRFRRTGHIRRPLPPRRRCKIGCRAPTRRGPARRARRPRAPGP